MLPMIAADFDVSPIFENDQTSLFMEKRQDVWHVVLATSTKTQPNRKSIHIEQYHWPRFSVARALATGGALETDTKITTSTGEIKLTLGGQSFLMPPKYVSEMQEDVRTFEEASTKIRSPEAGYEVIGAQSSKGHPVITEQRALAEAIAFEREVNGALQPEKFGAYSAYCTWRDFISEIPNKADNLAAAMAEEMCGWDPASFGDHNYWNSVFKIQEELWEERFWGPELPMRKDALLSAFSQALNALSSLQLAQFVLMNGMHPGGPFHPLAYLFNLMDFKTYKECRTYGFQPDSLEEQEIRTQSEFVRLLTIAD